MKQVLARLMVVQKLWDKYRDSARAGRLADIFPPAKKTPQPTEDDA